MKLAAGRLGARDPRAGQGGRAAPRPRQAAVKAAVRAAALLAAVAAACSAAGAGGGATGAAATGRCSASRRPARTARRARRRSRAANVGTLRRQQVRHSGHGRLLADLPARRERRRARPATCSSSRPPTASRSRSTPRAARSSGATRRPPTASLRRLAADHEHDAGRRPGRGPRSTPGLPTGASASSRSPTGKVLWATSITRDPTHEKLASALELRQRARARRDRRLHRRRAALPGARRHARPGERPDHRRLELPLLRPPRDHPALDLRRAATRRSGAARRRSVDPATGDLLVATGNGPFDGRTNWGDSVLVLSPDAKRLLKHWTPSNQEELNDRRPRPRLDRAGPALGRLLRPGRQGRPAAPAAALAASPA